MSFSYTFGSCLDRIMRYVRAVALEDVEIIHKGKEYSYLKYDVIKFGLSFFRSFPCLVCGKCCKDFLQIFVKSEYSKNEGWEANDEMIVNGKKILIYIKDHKVGEPCRFLAEDDKGVRRFCAIHESYGITCHAPHREPRIDKKNNVCNWTKRPYGRNHQKPIEKQCPGKPSSEYTIPEIEGDIKFFNHLKRVCEDLGVKNKCDDLIKIIKDFKRENELLEKGRLF